MSEDKCSSEFIVEEQNNLKMIPLFDQFQEDCKFSLVDSVQTLVSMMNSKPVIELGLAIQIQNPV